MSRFVAGTSCHKRGVGHQQDTEVGIRQWLLLLVLIHQHDTTFDFLVCGPFSADTVNILKRHNRQKYSLCILIGTLFQAKLYINIGFRVGCKGFLLYWGVAFSDVLESGPANKARRKIRSDFCIYLLLIPGFL